MKTKKAIFAVLVIIIVLAFSVSIFGSGVVGFLGNPKTIETPTAETVEDVPVSDDDAPSPFIQSIKSAMVVSADANENASNIAMVINVYNSLYKDSMILDIEGAFSAPAVQKLTDADIYFDDITPEAESAAWTLVTVDSDGVASSAK